MEYKILEDYDVFVEGDVLTEQKDGTFKMERKDAVNGYSYTCAVTVSKRYIDDLVSKGIAQDVCDIKATEAYETAIVERNRIEDKLTQYTLFLKRMKDTYEQDRLDAVEAYTDGDLSVNEYKQATTVYDNLIKFIDSSIKYLA